MAPLKSFICHFAVVLLLVVCSAKAAVSELVKVWELDLGKWRSPLASGEKFAVTGLSFSPDGKRVALAGDEAIAPAGKSIGRLLVIGVEDRQSVQVFEEPGGMMTPDWSPDETAIIINGVLVRLDTGASCALPSISRFLSGGRIIGEKRDTPSAQFAGNGLGQAPVRLTHIITFGADCLPIGEWQTHDGWNIVDVSTDRHLLLMNKPLAENLLVDPENGNVVRKWSVGSWRVSDGPGGYFADRGKALCGTVGGGFEDVQKGQNLMCWSADNGSLIASAPSDRAGAPISVAINSTRVVFSEYNYVKGLIRDWDSHPYKGAAVWDYATGKTLALWRPDMQTWYQEGIRPPKKITEPSKLAISPDGYFVAEAGNGKLTIYRVRP
jgi:hypothetical protein